MTRVSAVIANHNYGRFLPAALDSVFSQDCGESIELIVVDDGSTDDSRKVLKSYGEKIRCVLQDNLGQGAALNRGLSLARGEFICLLDSDDVWRKDKVRKVLEAFEKNPRAGMVQHLLQDTDSELRPLSMRLPDWPGETSIRDYLDGRAELTATSGVSLRGRTLRAALPIPDELVFNADEYLTVAALFEAPAANIPEQLALHRLHGGNNYAGIYSDPKKIVADFRIRRVLRKSLRLLLERHGLELSERFRRIEDLEYLRREILCHAQEGNRGKALHAWLRGALRHLPKGRGFFRLATCALAVASPGLYLKLYGSYARRGRAAPN